MVRLGMGKTLLALERNEEAVNYFKKAVERLKEDLKIKPNDSRTLYRLGQCYEKGQGVPQNYEQAVELYRRASEQKFPPAQYNLGVCYGLRC